MLFLDGSAFATPYQISYVFSGADQYGRINGSDTSLTVIDDPGDNNDAYAAISQYGEEYALASIQGTHSSVTATAIHQSGFTLQGSGNVDLEISYNLLVEMFSINQASVATSAIIGIYQYYPAEWGGNIVNGAPVWQDSVSTYLNEALLGVTYDQRIEKLNTTATLTLPSVYQFGGNYQYMVELYANVRGEDTYRIQFQPGVYENPDAFYSAAAYADPTFTVLTPGASIYEFAINPQGPSSLTGGTLDPPPTPDIPEPATMLLLGAGVVSLAGFSRTFIR